MMGNRINQCILVLYSQKNKIMKAIKSLFVFLIIISAVACSKDDSPRYEYNKNNLTGTYSLVYLESKEVKTVKVDGFDVVTTTELKGDTFSTTYSFSSDNSLTKDGTYRVVETKTQNDQTQETSYIVVLDNEQVSFSVQEDARLLTIEGVSYDVSHFNETGFRIKRTESREVEGMTVDFEEELRFEK